VNLSSYTSTYATPDTEIFEYNASQEVITVQAEYLQPDANSEAWLNHITLNGRARLTMTGDALAFRDSRSAGSGKISEFRLSNATARTVIWDITDPNAPLNIPYTRSGSMASFRLETPVLREFIAFESDGDFPEPLVSGEGLGRINNQDLHGTAPPEMLIIYADSGSNELPVQLAIEAKERGVLVVGVGSFKYAAIAPRTVVAKTLFEVVDFAIDNHGVPGDALVGLEGSDWRVAASSTLIGVTIWNCLLTEAVFRLHAEGEALPITASFNMPGAAEHNARLLGEWSKLNPHLPARNITLRKKVNDDKDTH